MPTKEKPSSTIPWLPIYRPLPERTLDAGLANDLLYVLGLYANAEQGS